ncbi:hypothetical protein A6g_01645 [Bacillus velezensis]|nr:hypothetical protein A6g_01645 [Bacillus velezensis]
MRKTPSFLVFLLFYYRRMDILRKNKGCRDFLDSLTVLVRTVFLFAISISLFRISTADKAFSIFLACVNFLFHSESMRRET